MTTDLPLLNYVLDPQTVYITTQAAFPSVATFTIGAVNNTGGDITVSSLQFSQNGLTQVAVISATTTSPNWTISADTLRAVPNPGHAVMQDGDSVTFQIQLQIDNQEGIGSLSLLELASNDDGLHRGDQTWPIIKNRSPTEITQFRSQPAVINPGGTATLSWTTVQAETCFLYSAPIGAALAMRAMVLAANGLQVPTNGQLPVSPPTTTVYTLVCQGLGPDQSAQLTLGVLRVAISAQLNPPNIMEGDSSTLSWTIVNATSATLSPGPNGEQSVTIDPVSGNLPLSPHSTTTYTIEATGPGTNNTSRFQVTLSVTQKAFISSFILVRYAQPSLTLQWDAGNATLFRLVAPDVGYQMVAGANIRTVVIQIPDGVYAGLREDGKDSITFTLNAVGAGNPPPWSLPVKVL